ncbi:enoyl-ACP reductase FabI [Streptomyces sp. BE230]|uniref:enoyl-ACP reductase FabI n=1 Tax=Streptomyces sp. BE230 TaxID=3002526 RepID=UPI002ED646E4|nr:enoyl-ACP reductase FabI [Streptomyces sp. BE230]
MTAALLDGRTVLVTGVLNEASLAFAAARSAQEAGARVVLTGYQRMASVERAAARLPEPAPVVPLDVTSPDDLSTLAGRLSPYTNRVDGLVHAVGWAPRPPGYPGFTAADWATHAGPALHTSAHSLAALISAVLPLMPEPSSVVALDFDASQAWPGYDWMGVAKAALEACARYAARELGPRGIRVNLVACGPVRTVSSHGEPEFDRIAATWQERAPLGWNPRNTDPVGRACVTFLSDLLPATTGEILHVDGGAHAYGM